jgi:hypothetical protein
MLALLPLLLPHPLLLLLPHPLLLLLPHPLLLLLPHPLLLLLPHPLLLLQPKWAKVKGLKDALGDGRVVSNMAFETAPLTFKALENLKEGHAVFTMPTGVIKCPGAGQKACYISEGARVVGSTY